MGQLVVREKAAVGQPRPRAAGVDDAAHARLEPLADLVEEVRQRGVVGGLFHSDWPDRRQFPQIVSSALIEPHLP